MSAGQDSTSATRLGVWSMLGSPHLLPALADAGFDWVCLDQQHGRFEDASTLDGIASLQASPITTVVRVRSLDAGLIGRALDAGADGVIVPMVADADQAAAAVRATYYPPMGERSWGPIAARHGRSVGDVSVGEVSVGEVTVSEATVGDMNGDILCAVMVETPGAIAHVDEIAATAGLDMIFVGPFDLSLALGRDVDDLLGDFADGSPLQTIVAACRTAGIAAGAFAGTPERALLLQRHGFSFVAAATDALVATRGGRALLDAARSA